MFALWTPPTHTHTSSSSCGNHMNSETHQKELTFTYVLQLWPSLLGPSECEYKKKNWVTLITFLCILHPAGSVNIFDTWQQEVSIIKEVAVEPRQRWPDSKEGPVPAQQDTLCHLTPSMSCQPLFYAMISPPVEIWTLTSIWWMWPGHKDQTGGDRIREKAGEKDEHCNTGNGMTHLSQFLIWCIDMQPLINRRSMMWGSSGDCI